VRVAGRMCERIFGSAQECAWERVKIRVRARERERLGLLDMSSSGDCVSESGSVLIKSAWERAIINTCERA
jgi:hypothetical protein